MEILKSIWKHTRWILLTVIICFIVFHNCKMFKAIDEPVKIKPDAETPLINSLKASLTKFIIKQKRDSVANVILKSRIPEKEFIYLKASNKAYVDLKNKVCDTITVRNLKRSGDSLFVAYKAVLKSDSIRIAGYEKAQAGWIYLNDLQDKRHAKDTLLRDSLVKEIPKAYNDGKKKGRRQGFGVGAIATQVINSGVNSYSKFKP